MNARAGIVNVLEALLLGSLAAVQVAVVGCALGTLGRPSDVPTAPSAAMVIDTEEVRS